MRCLVLILCSLMLAGCAGPQRLEGSGTIAPAPLGHAIACAKDPSLAGCPK